jgi:hypothetical protein
MLERDSPQNARTACGQRVGLMTRAKIASRNLHAAPSPPAFPTVLALDSALLRMIFILIRIQIRIGHPGSNLHLFGIYLREKIYIPSRGNGRERWAVGRRPG